MPQEPDQITARYLSHITSGSLTRIYMLSLFGHYWRVTKARKVIWIFRVTVKPQGRDADLSEGMRLVHENICISYA